VWTFDARLFWHFSEDTQLRVWQVLELELTDSNETRSRQEPMLADLDLRLDHALVRRALSNARELTVRGGIHTTAPLSRASRAAGVLLSLGPRLGAALEMRDWLHGATLSALVGYRHRFATANSVRADVAYPCMSQAGLGECEFLGSAASVRDLLEANLMGELAFSEAWSATLWLRLDYARAHELAPAQITTDTGSTVTLPDRSPSRFRNTRLVYIAVDYAVHPAVELSASVTNRFSERDADGELRAPLRPVDTIIGLAATLRIDHVLLGMSAP
jgi:hypothetical protein